MPKSYPPSWLPEKGGNEKKAQSPFLGRHCASRKIWGGDRAPGTPRDAVKMPFWRRRGLGEWVPLAPGMLLARFWDSFTRSPVASWDLKGGKKGKKWDFHPTGTRGRQRWCLHSATFCSPASAPLVIFHFRQCFKAWTFPGKLMGWEEGVFFNCKLFFFFF